MSTTSSGAPAAAQTKKLFETNTLNHEGMLVDGWTSFTCSGFIDKVLQKMRALSRTGGAQDLREVGKR